MILRVGTRLGHYEILSRIGSGGMGVVYRARDTRLQRHVAIKTLPDHLAANAAAVDRFEQEARAVAALSHRNILVLHDVGNEQNTLFTVTELLEGQTLRDRLTKNALDWREATAIAAEVAEGLTAAHAKGVIHRDLKPANIFLTTEGVVKILDFGLARLVQVGECATADTETPTETVSVQTLGTIGYMSPEQIRGEPADAPSDIFSLGCTLYEMLTGRRPFARPSSTLTLAATLEAEPPAMSTSERWIPPNLEEIVRRCLEKDPQQRFQSAQELTLALRAALGEKSVPIAAAKGRRFRTAVMAVGLGAALAASYLYWQSWQSNAIESIAVLPFANVGGDPAKEYLSDGITETLINSLSELPDLRVTARTRAFRYRDPQGDPVAAGRELDVRHVLTGRVVERDGWLNIQAELVGVGKGTQVWGHQYRLPLGDILIAQREITRAVSAKLQRSPTAENRNRYAKRSTDNAEAYQLFLKGRYHWNRRSEPALRRAAEYFRQAIDQDPTYALAYAGLADCYAVYNSYQVELPRESALKAKAAALKALEIDDSLAEAHASLGMVHMVYEWDWAAAEREFQRAITLKPDYATAHHWYAIGLTATGRNEEALASLERARQADPLSLIIHADIGMVLHFARRYDEAIQQLRGTLDMDAAFGAALRHIGMAYEQKGMHEEAVAAFRKSLDASQGNPFAIGSLGHAYALSGNRAKALETLSEISKAAEGRYVSPFASALVYTGLNEKESALAWLEKAADDRSLEMIFLGVDPRFDRLRALPGFAKLVSRMGLKSADAARLR